MATCVQADLNLDRAPTIRRSTGFAVAASGDAWKELFDLENSLLQHCNNTGAELVRAYSEEVNDFPAMPKKVVGKIKVKFVDGGPRNISSAIEDQNQ